ncbi:Fe(3+)-hydroxamate ABC transporter permease FhuB [Aquabacter spiritensis]|uniref:Iron complex transport system permease protein n=1 Tax=Aquabacter spiritensis TaxID=933073 RepID=A0A4R3M2V3_9HYPH|nr:Fe(3+)-hydroxamate ABC transporter permease FhuB [Aquabacter spiritensis]TCT05475.1 iron complex transport system permease protein [Aquabacter spiritensis]
MTDPVPVASAFRRSLPAWAGLFALGCALLLAGLVRLPPIDGDPATVRRLHAAILWHSLLPRAATALLAGAALGLAGALLQRVLRNPIADPSTLGIASGAQLALTLALAFAPGLLAVSREGVAFAGGVAAVALVLAMSWRRGLDPITVVIAGMTLSLMAAAASSALILARGEYVLSVFIWGAGSLHQQSWHAAQALAVQLALGAAAAAALLRPLAVLSLDDAGAHGLGVRLHAIRAIVIGVAVGLAASVIAQVGIIGFVGLAAPALARASGARTQGQILLAAPLIGSLLVWLADGLIQVAGGDLVPTGAAIGLLGGPLLLWMLPKLKPTTPVLAAAAPIQRLHAPWRTLAFLLAGGVFVGAVVLLVGRDLDGWAIAGSPLLADLLPFRLPRIVAAASAGALLGAAGGLMQRLTGNPLAGPEVLGVGAGAGVGLAAVLLLADAPGTATLMAGSAAGALAALLAILLIGLWTGFGADRLLMAGIALGCMGLAVLSAVFAAGGWTTFRLLVWMSGSTDKVGPPEAVAMALAALVLLAPLPLLARWIDILPLGSAVSRGVGLPLTAARLALCVLAALMTAVATFFVGPLSLVGLLGPHLARLLGFAGGTVFLAAAALIGANVLILADWLGRTLAFPYQIPVGLFAALVGGPYLIWLLQRGPAHRG